MLNVNINEQQNQQSLQTSVSGSNDWDNWLLDFEKKLKSKSYVKYNQKYKMEDFAYWITVKKDDVSLYQIGVLFYDFRKFLQNRIGVQFECSILTKERIDLSVSSDITFYEFEIMASSFFDTFG